MMLSQVEAPLYAHANVIEDWIGYNGHLNMAYYNVIFDHGVDNFYDLLNVGAAMRPVASVPALPWKYTCTTYKN